MGSSSPKVHHTAHPKRNNPCLGRGARDALSETPKKKKKLFGLRNFMITWFLFFSFVVIILRKYIKYMEISEGLWWILTIFSQIWISGTYKLPSPPNLVWTILSWLKNVVLSKPLMQPLKKWKKTGQLFYLKNIQRTTLCFDQCSPRLYQFLNSKEMCLWREGSYESYGFSGDQNSILSKLGQRAWNFIILRFFCCRIVVGKSP